MILKYLAVLASFSIFLNPQCQAWDDDFTSWMAVFAQGPIQKNSKIGTFLEAQLRGGATINSSNRILLRAAARYEIQPSFFAYAGYGWTPNLSPFRNEHRIWEQLQYSTKILSQNFLLRFRHEQRWIERTQDLAHRSRLMVRTLASTGMENVSFAVWDELFINWNTLNNGPAKGFDQNRLFFGPSFAFDGGKILLEPGYLNVSLRRPTFDTGIMNHVAAFFVFVNF